MSKLSKFTYNLQGLQINTVNSYSFRNKTFLRFITLTLTIVSKLLADNTIFLEKKVIIFELI